MIALADRLGCAALATGHYARIADDGEGPLLARRRRPGQGPDLHALRPAPGVAGPAALPARRAVASRGCARSRPRPGCRWPTRPRARTSASSPARASARSSAATAASRERPGPDRRPRGPDGRASTGAITTSPSASGAGCGVGGSEPLLRARHRRADEHGRRRLARRARHRTAITVRDATLHRPGRAGRPGAAPLPLAPARAAPLRRWRRGARASSSSSWPSRPTASRPARPPACCPATWSSGGPRSPRSARTRAYLDWRAMRSDEIRETFLSFFEERGHLRVPSSSLVPAPDDTSTLLTVAGHAAVQALLRGPRGAAEPPADHRAADLSHRRHRGRRARPSAT